MAVDFKDHLWAEKMPIGEVMIYALVDSRHKESPRYVGQSRKPSARLWEHKREGMGGKYPNLRNNWIRSVIRSGGEVLMRPLEVVSENDAATAEAKWMCALRDAGCKLKNGTEFTDVRLLSKTALLKVAKRNREAWAKPDVRAKRIEALNRPDVVARNSAAVKASWANQETRERLLAIRASEEFRAAHSAAMNSDDYRAKQSERTKRAWADPESRKRRLDNQKVAFENPELRAHLSAKRKEKLADPEFLARISKKAKEVSNTPEAKAQRSKIMQGLLANPDYRAKISKDSSERARAMWADPEKRAKILSAMRRVKPDTGGA